MSGYPYYGMDGQRISRDEYLELFADDNARRVGWDKIGDVTVSTVLLGIDHGWPRDGTNPIIFETMIFGGNHDEYQERYATKAEAEAGHARALALVRSTA